MGQLYVALLRGVNVGGRNKIAMKALTSIFARCGCTDVRTYIQSGNVVFAADPAAVDRMPGLLSAELWREAGIDVPVVVRSALEMQQVVASNPFTDGGAAVDRLHVAFLATAPDSADIGNLDPLRSPPDEFVVRGSEIYLHCPGGMARTKLTNDYFDRTLRTTSTVRNWNTVLKLAEMCR